LQPSQYEVAKVSKQSSQLFWVSDDTGVRFGDDASSDGDACSGFIDMYVLVSRLSSPDIQFDRVRAVDGYPPGVLIRNKIDGEPKNLVMEPGL
jgi:hypothetical protein